MNNNVELSPEDQELKNYFEHQFELFGTIGWKDLISKIDEQITAYSDIKNIKTVEQLHLFKGALSTLEWLKKWPELIQESYNMNFSE